MTDGTLKGSVGSGVLAMPHAFKQSGTVFGVVGTVILSTFLTYAIIVLVRSQNIVCKIKKRPYLPYPYALENAWKLGPKGFQVLAPFAPAIVDFFLVVYQMGICVSYLAYISTSLKEILEPSPFKYEMDYRWYLFFILTPILAINTIRSLKSLSVVSLTADVLTIVTMLLIVYYMVGTGPLKLHETTYFGTVVDYPLFFGTVMFSLEAVGVFLAVERNMKTPQHFPRVFSKAMIVVIFLYTFMGFMGYAKYAENVHGSITQSIPKGSPLSLVVKALVAFCIYCSYPLQCYVSLEIIWKNYLKHYITDKEKWDCAEYCMRAIVISTTFIIVLGVSKFELIVAFVGAFCLSTLGLIMPFAMELCVLWPDKNYGPYKYVLVKDILGIILGFVMLILGTYVAILAVIKDTN